MPIFASSGNAEIAATVSCVHLHKLRNPGAVIGQVFQMMPIPESAQEPAPLLVPFFGFPLPCVSLLWIQTDSLGSTNIPCSRGLSYHSANKQRPCWHWDSVSDFELCLLSCLSCHHLLPFLPFLPSFLRPVPKLSQPLDLKCSPSCLECELTSADFNVGLDFASILLVRDRQDAVPTHLERGLQVANQLLPLLGSCAKILQFAPIWNQVFVAEVLGAFLHSPNVAAPRDPRVLLSGPPLSVKAPKCNIDLFALFQTFVNCFCTQRTELLVECALRDDVVLIFHQPNHSPGKLSRTQ